MEMICMACGKKTSVSADQARTGSYRCPSCHRQIKILTPEQAKSLVRELRSVYRRHLGRVRIKGEVSRTTRRVPRKK